MSLSFIYVRATSQPFLIDRIVITSEPKKLNPSRLSPKGKTALEQGLARGLLEITRKPAPREKLSDVILGKISKEERDKLLSDVKFSYLESRAIEFSDETPVKKEPKKKWPRRKYLVIIPLMVLLASLFLLLSK